MNIENKISKICWNSEGWKFPSGSKGKSVASESYEAKYGFGHEEWLFDKSRMIDGYHYAFLQPLNLKTDKHVGKIYNISLFTITNSKKYFVGEIKNAECISREKSREIYEIYKQQGWLKQMSEEVERAGANSKILIDTPSEVFFNVKFKFNDVYRPDELEQISKENENITTTRFKLLTKKSDFNIETEPQEDETEGNLKNTKFRKRIYKGEGEFDPYHDKMQNALCELLRNSYKSEYRKVLIEKGRVDIKAKTHNDKWHYFEIKTDSPKLSIRKALGQIMEYSYWPDLERAEKLIIVSNSEPDLETQKYLSHIRNKFNIPIAYRFFNMDGNILSHDY
jgi:hypothetical protein